MIVIINGIISWSNKTLYLGLISWPGDKSKVKSFVRSRNYPVDDNYHIIFDFDKKLSRKFSAQPIPLTLILKDNKVVYRKRGFYLGDEVELKNELDKVLSD
jgi:thiol:disulfide interchange protein DsbD